MSLFNPRQIQLHPPNPEAFPCLGSLRFGLLVVKVSGTFLQLVLVIHRYSQIVSAENARLTTAQELYVFYFVFFNYFKRIFKVFIFLVESISCAISHAHINIGFSTQMSNIRIHFAQLMELLHEIFKNLLTTFLNRLAFITIALLRDLFPNQTIDARVEKQGIDILARFVNLSSRATQQNVSNTVVVVIVL